MIHHALPAAALALLAGPALAQQAKAERPAALVRLVDCRGLESPADRLACYDREVAALDAAEAARELVVVDQQQIRTTRRTLFGLALPNLGLFGSDNPDDEGMGQIETTLRGAIQGRDGKWTFILEDGARWVQLDTRKLARDPRAGHPIKIRRAAMGSYLANVNNEIAMRVQRVR